MKYNADKRTILQQFKFYEFHHLKKDAWHYLNDGTLKEMPFINMVQHEQHYEQLKGTFICFRGDILKLRSIKVSTKLLRKSI